MNAKSSEITNPIGRFGTFEGVFTPCVVTILGVIMFMRSGYVVGQSGLWLSLVILGISKIITTLTTLSLSAISTNTEIRGGGVYYMISRVLGPDFGGTIGITLFLANAVGVSFYVIGFSEAILGAVTPLFTFIETENQSVTQVFTQFYVPQIFSSLTIGVLFFLTFRGADVALKFQKYVLYALLISIASFIVGGVLNFDAEIFEASKLPDYSANMGFWAAFAIFFPAATGITAGANMSGDLKNPERSIPWGTLYAIAFTAVIYLLQIVLIAGVSSRQSLQLIPFEALQAMSVFGPLIILGVFAATISSALGSFLGAPRILQAMGKDGLMSYLKYFAKGEGESDEPKRATICTFVIAILVIWAGDLNQVAEVISMFFLIAYGMINLSAFVESKSGNPSFRPKFKYFHWITGLAGAVGCAVAMMKINDTYALLALSISGIIYFYLKKQNIKTSYGDAKRGYVFKGIRDNLLYLEGSKAHAKSWRPILVAVTGDIKKDVSMFRAGAWIESERGMYTMAYICQTSATGYLKKIVLREDGIRELEAIKKAENIDSFSDCLVADDYHEGVFSFLQCHSLGVLKPNSVLLAAPKRSEGEAWESFLKTIEIVASFDFNLVIYKPGEMNLNKKKRTIDIWWRGESNGSLMALFAYLMTLSPAWSGSKIRLLRAISADEDHEKTFLNMSELTRQARIDAEIKIVALTEGNYDVIQKTSSSEADIVLLGMGATDGHEAKKSLEKIYPLVEELPSTLLVWSNGDANIFV